MNRRASIGTPMLPVAGVVDAMYSPNDGMHVQRSYTRLDAIISVESRDRRWGLDVIGNNLTDRLIKSFIADYPTALHSVLRQYQPLRNVAVQFRYHC